MGLSECQMGATHHTYLAIAPGLLCQPFNRVVAVNTGRIVDNVEILASPFGLVATAEILKGQNIAIRNEILLQLGKEPGPLLVV